LISAILIEQEKICSLPENLRQNKYTSFH